MQTSTLPELIRREGIPEQSRIFFFRKEEGKGVIEFELPTMNEPGSAMTSGEALRRLQALQFDLGRPTNSVMIIRAMRRERLPRRTSSRTPKRRKP